MKSKHVDVVFDITNNKQIELIDRFIKEETADGLGAKIPSFKVHLVPQPRPTPDMLRDFYDGWLYGPNEGRNAFSRRTVRGEIKEKGLNILDATMEDPENIRDRPNWEHLAIIFPNSRGKIPQSIKAQFQRAGKKKDSIKSDRVDEMGNRIEVSLPQFYWRERYAKKILVLLFYRTPSVEAMNRYDRIWICHKSHMDKVKRRCRKCGNDMRFNKKTYDEMLCKKCGRHEAHPKIIYVGDDFSKIDLYDEYEKVMG